MPQPIHGASLMGQYIRNSNLINENFSCKFFNLSTAKTVERMGFSFTRIPIYCVQVLKILFSIVKFKPDLIYWTPSAGGLSFFLRDFPLYLFSKVHKCKYIFHYHNKGVRKGKFCSKIYKVFLKDNFIILLGKELQKEFEPYVDTKKIFICANGIPQLVKRNYCFKEKFKKTNVNFLFLSNLIIEKGIFVLLDACEKLAAMNIQFECNIVGAETSELTSISLKNEIDRRQLSGIVNYLGKKYDDDKISCFESTDVFVFPTYYSNECCPLVLIEAMQFSLPCISSAVGVIPSMIENGENGYIIPIRDSEALFERMKILAEDPQLRNTMGKKAYSKYQEFYSLKAFEERIMNIFQNILN